MNTETDFAQSRNAAIEAAQQGVLEAQRMPQATEAERIRKDARMVQAQRILKARTEN